MKIIHNTIATLVPVIIFMILVAVLNHVSAISAFNSLSVEEKCAIRFYVGAKGTTYESVKENCRNGELPLTMN